MAEDPAATPEGFAEAKAKLLKLTPQEVFFAMMELSPGDRDRVNELISEVGRINKTAKEEAERRDKHDATMARVDRMFASKLAALAHPTTATPASATGLGGINISQASYDPAISIEQIKEVMGTQQRLKLDEEMFNQLVGLGNAKSG